MKISKLYVPMLESHMFLQNHKNIINETIHLGGFTLKEGGIFFHLECFVFIILFYLSIEKKQLISSYTRSLLDLLCPTASRSRISSMKATMKYWNCIFQLWYQSQMSWTTYRKITPSLILKTNVCRWFPSGLLERLVFNRMKPNNVSIVKRCPMKVLAPSLRSSANFFIYTVLNGVYINIYDPTKASQSCRTFLLDIFDWINFSQLADSCVRMPMTINWLLFSNPSAP